MKIFFNRIQSYKHWPLLNVTPLSLATAGFYYTGISDRVQCPYCKGVLQDWQQRKFPFEEHKNNFPHCQMVSGQDVCGAHDVSRFSTPTMFTYGARFVTYISWPSDKSQDPRDMVLAGFYYVGLPDVVQCFQCGVKMQDWKSDDDPWEQHALHNPECTHVLKNKGVDFVKQVLYQSNEEKEDDKEERLVAQALVRGCKQTTLLAVLRNHRVCEVRRFNTVEEIITEVEAYERKQVEPGNHMVDNRCVICLDKERQVLFRPCGHFICCGRCSLKVKSCPLCSVLIYNRARGYLA